MHPHQPIYPPPPPPKPKRRLPFIVHFLGWAFSIGTIALAIGFAGVSWYVYKLSAELPDYKGLKDYDPAIMTRVHANDGSLLAEYAKERRIYVPANVMPQQLINAFLSAEDKNFFEHKGIDPEGIIKAVIRNLRNSGRRAGGASTITQQVAKNFLLTNERTIDRKIKEAILAIRIEQALSKEHILELYLNQIFLGLRSYGVAAASLNYFDRSLDELEVHQMAYLASLPKAPNNYHPFRHTKRALARRNWVLDRMVVNGFLDAEKAEAAKQRPLDVNPRPLGAHIFAAEFFAEEVRRELVDHYGEDKVYTGGLSVRTTLVPRLQRMARKALINGLVSYDRKTGWRGPVDRIETSGDWGVALSKVEPLSDVAPWRLAVVLDVNAERAEVGLRPPDLKSGRTGEKRETGILLFEDMKWSKPFLKRAGKRNLLGKKPKKVSDTLAVGDVIYVAPADANTDKKKSKSEPKLAQSEKGLTRWQLMQIPEVGGAMVVMDPHTGRVLALVGGFSFAESQFNRATQAKRQPGSAFKPFVYATALDNGYTPATVVVDAPIVIDQGPGKDPWKPSNYNTRFYGPQTLRIGIEKSRNLMTVRLAQNLGMAYISEYARRFGVYDNLQPVLSMSLGAGETTLLRMATGYCILANGGKKVKATLIDRIQDRRGITIFRHDKRECPGCDTPNAEWHNQREPLLKDIRKPVIDPQTSYQITSMMEGVVQRGTATVVRKVGKPLAGKTGTTNDYKDAWFMGYSPDLVAGIYIGYDDPRGMGRKATGGGLAAPVFKDFMTLALVDKPAAPFRIPPGIRLITINSKTGLRTSPRDSAAIQEAFKDTDEMPRDYDPVLEQYQSPADGTASAGGSGGWETREKVNAPSGFGDVY